MKDKKLYDEWLDYRINLIMRGETWLRFDEWLAAGRPNRDGIVIAPDSQRLAKELARERELRKHADGLVLHCMAALREIAGEDYRGPRPSSAYIAERALRHVCGWNHIGGNNE